MENAAKIVVAVPEDLSRELVSQFLGSCRDDLVRLRAALASGDYDRARRLGHQMKGNGTPYGFPGVTLLGSSIEQAAARAPSELASQIELLENYLTLVEIA